MEYGVRQCTKADFKRMRCHIPPELREFMSGKSQVTTTKGNGNGAYQGYDVIQIVYEFNMDGENTKVLPMLVSKYSEKLGKLVQVSVIIKF